MSATAPDCAAPDAMSDAAGDVPQPWRCYVCMCEHLKHMWWCVWPLLGLTGRSGLASSCGEGNMGDIAWALASSRGGNTASVPAKRTPA